MVFSRKQKALLHQAATAAGATDDERRLVQRNIGGFYSAADRTTTREGFIAVMAFWERRCGGVLRGFTPGYWADQDRDCNPVDGLRHKARSMATALGWNEDALNAFLAGRHMSGGAAIRVEAASAYWLHRLVEGLKAMQRRSTDPALRSPLRRAEQSFTDCTDSKNKTLISQSAESAKSADKQP